jgi:hypothetical protein
MNRGRITLIIGVVTVVLLAIGLTVYGLQRNQQQATNNGTQYTDSISGQKFTAFGGSSDQRENGEVTVQPANEIVITGFDDFMSSVNQDQAQSILHDLTTFVRARVGAHSTRAGILDAKIDKTSDNPAIYKFTLVVVNPASRYSVTITMPTTTNLTPQVTFGGITQ